MFRQIFLVFFLLFLACWQLSRHGIALDQVQVQSDTERNTIYDEFLKPEKNTNKITFGLGSKGEENVSNIVVKNIKLINLVAVNGVMVALAQVIENDEKINILAKFYEKKDGNWGTNAVTKGEESKWKVQLAAKDLEKKTKSNNIIKSLASATAKGNKIYHITVSNDTLKELLEPPAVSGDWHLRLIKGEVTTDTTEPVEGAEKKKTKSGNNRTFFLEHFKTKPI